MTTILIVEDEPYIAQMYQSRFEKNGYRVLLAFDGISGVQFAKSKRVDVILLDLVLPGKSGYEILQQLKKGRKTRSIPIIIASNLSQEDEIQRGLALGALDYIVKTSFTPAQLVQRVDIFLEKVRLK